MIKIIIVDDHQLVREAMASSIEMNHANVKCVGVATAREAIELIEQDAEWGMIIIDLMLPKTTGFVLLNALAKRFPAVPCIIVSALDDSDSIQRAMALGARGFVTKAGSGQELNRAVGSILSGGSHRTVLPANASQKRPTFVKAAELNTLTSSQRRVLDLMAEGLTNKEIAWLLQNSEGTVKVHVTAILKTLGVSSRSQAIVALSKLRS